MNKETLFNYEKEKDIREIFGEEFDCEEEEELEIIDDTNVNSDIASIEIINKFLDSNGKEITFNDVIGYQDIKNKLKQTLSYINNVDKYKSMGVETPKGIFILGEPGIGKTMLSQAFVNESGLKCYFVSKKGSPSTFPNYLEKVFLEASKNVPCIILLDDIDKFSGRKNDVEVFHTLQSLIDKVRNLDIYIIATANSKKHLPKSLYRDGRFDTNIIIDEISQSDKVELLKHFMSSKNVNSNLNFDDISSIVVSSTPISIKKTINTAMLIALNKDKSSPEMIDLIDAFLGSDLSSGKWKDEKDLKEIAYHEAGHALVSEIVQPGSVGFVSIIRTQNEGGKTILKDKIIRRVPYTLTLLGGKTSVELNFPKNASGCYSDVGQAVDAILEGLDNNATSGYSILNMYNSNVTRDRLNIIAGELLTSYEKIDKSILINNRDLLDSIVNLLLKNGFMLRSEFDSLIKEHPLVIDALTYLK